MHAHHTTRTYRPLGPLFVLQITIATNLAGRGTDILLGGNPKGLVQMLLENKLLGLMAPGKAGGMLLRAAERRLTSRRCWRLVLTGRAFAWMTLPAVTGASALAPLRPPTTHSTTQRRTQTHVFTCTQPIPVPCRSSD